MWFAVFNFQRFLEWPPSWFTLFHKLHQTERLRTLEDIVILWKCHSHSASGMGTAPTPGVRKNKFPCECWHHLSLVFLLATSWHIITYCGCSRLSSQTKGSFYLVYCLPANLRSWRVLQGKHALILVPFSPPPPPCTNNRVFPSLGNTTKKSFPCCSESINNNFLTMSQEDGCCKTVFQTRRLLFLKKRFKDSIAFSSQPSISTICLCMSCVFFPSEGENADKLSHVDKRRKNLAAFSYFDRDTFISQCTTYQTDAKMWASQSSELTEWLCLHYIFWFVWILFLAIHKGQ